MKLINFLSAFLLLYLFYGFYVSTYDTQIFKKAQGPQSSSHFYYYRGIANVHSNKSLGSSAINQIIEAARKASLDFLIFTDLNVFPEKGIDQNTQGFVSLFGAKYSYLDSRLIYLSANKSSEIASMGEAQVFIANLIEQRPEFFQDSLMYLASPFYLGFQWQGNFPVGLDGLEIVNVKSMAMKAWDQSKLSVIWSLLLYPFNPRYAFLRLITEPEEELKWMDQLSHTRKIVGYAGAEASARAIPLSSYPIRFPSYQKTFEIASTHVQLVSELTGNLRTDREKLVHALKQGNSFLAFDILADATGFECFIKSENGIFPIGAQIPVGSNQRIYVKLPGAISDFFEVVLFRDGQRYKTSNELETEFSLDMPGSYRVMVRVSPLFPLPDAKRWVPWIYTNIFQVL